MTRSFIVVATLLASQCLAAEQAVHPPYPDRWIWSPGVNTEEWWSTSLYRMPNGDVLVSRGSETETFFRGVRYASVEAAFDSKYPPSDRAHRIARKDGTFTLRIGSHDGCAGGTNSAVAIHDAQGRPLRSVALLLQLDRPLERQATVCEEQDKPAWASRVVVMDPGNLLALEDGTFLVVDNLTGTVVRMSPDLTVGSSVPRLVVVDSQILLKRAYDFRLPAPAYGIDWPAYFEYLRQTYFGNELQLPARLLGTWIPHSKNFWSFAELRLTPETFSWSDCAFEKYRVIRAEGDGPYQIEVLRSPPCDFHGRKAFLTFDFSAEALRFSKQGVAVSICGAQDEFGRPPSQRYCSWGLMVRKEPVEDSAAAASQ